MERWLVIGFSLLLAACQPAYVNGVPNEDSPYFTVPADSKFILRQDVVVPAGDDGVYFQDSQVMRWSAVNIYRPHCALRVAKQDAPRLVKPDTFTVRKTHTERFFKQVRGMEPVRVAAADPATAFLDLDSLGGQGGYEVTAAVMQLDSARQPQVTQLLCADWRQPQGSTYITVRKIRRILGVYFLLELAVPRVQ